MSEKRELTALDVYDAWYNSPHNVIILLKLLGFEDIDHIEKLINDEINVDLISDVCLNEDI